MSKYRTAMGKMVDMAALASKNEHVRAVGNLKVNARGDTIDAHGRVIKPVTDRVSELYSKTVGNKSAQVRSKPAPPLPKVDFSELAPAERELEENLEEDIEIEKIKAKESKK